MIELGDHSAKDVVVSYKSFCVITKVNGKLVPTATISESLELTWLNDIVPSTAVREAIDGFIAEMEHGFLHMARKKRKANLSMRNLVLMGSVGRQVVTRNGTGPILTHN